MTYHQWMRAGEWRKKIHRTDSPFTTAPPHLTGERVDVSTGKPTRGDDSAKTPYADGVRVRI